VPNQRNGRDFLPPATLVPSSGSYNVFRGGPLLDLPNYARIVIGKCAALRIHRNIPRKARHLASSRCAYKSPCSSTTPAARASHREFVNRDLKLFAHNRHQFLARASEDDKSIFVACPTDLTMKRSRDG
jgi:hypothetical protein